MGFGEAGCLLAIIRGQVPALGSGPSRTALMLPAGQPCVHKDSQLGALGASKLTRRNGTLLPSNFVPRLKANEFPFGSLGSHL